MYSLPDPSLSNTVDQWVQKRADFAAADRRIRRALELLHEAHTLQVADIASRLNLSESRFRHLFKQQLGVSPTHYLKLVRYDQARGLLERSFLTVKEVAVSVGVNDISHFVRDYKAIYGRTPSEARRIWTGSRCGVSATAVVASK